MGTAFLGVAAPALTLTGVKSALVRVVVKDGADDFDVQNPLKRYTVRWAEVEEFVCGSGGFGSSMVEIQLKRGKRIKCYALAGRYPERWGTASRFAEEFNRMLTNRTNSPPCQVTSGAGRRS